MLRDLRNFDNDRVYADPKGLEQLQAAAIEKLKKFEFTLRRKAENGNDSLSLSGSDQVPEGFRQAIEEYLPLAGEEEPAAAVSDAVRTRVLTAGSVVLLAAAAALAQFGGPRGPFHEYPNIPYDGQFTFVRLKYTHGPGGNWYGGWPAWGHGYPLSEQNLMRIMNEVSYINPHVDEINALTLDDPALFHYPARVHHRGRLVGDDRSRSGGAARVPRRRAASSSSTTSSRGAAGSAALRRRAGGDLGGDYGTGWEVFERR